MSFDFSTLRATADPAQKPQQAHTKDFIQKTGKDTATPEKPATGVINIMQRDRVDITRGRAVYTEYQENMKRAEGLRESILKGIRRAEAPELLLLQAVECIGNMTDDRAFQKQATADIIAIYGEGLQHPAPLARELDELREKIAKLQGRIEHMTPDARQRARNALQQMENRARDIEDILQSKGA